MRTRRNDTADMILILLSMCLFVYTLLCFASCSTPRGAVSSQKDSVRTVITERVVYRDTVIEVSVPVETDRAVQEDTDTSLLRTSLAESEAYVSGGRLHHTLRNRSELVQPIRLKMPQHVQTAEHTRLATRTVTVEVERELTRWQKFFITLGQGASLALLAALLYIAVRLIRKFI